MDTYLETERLTLRRFTADDADLLIELDSDPAVMRYLTGGEPTAPEVVRERHLPNILAGYERWDGNLGLFAAHEKDGGAFNGYATEGSRALLAKAFTELGVRVVWAETMAVNHGSRNIMAKLGMTLAALVNGMPSGSRALCETPST
ncbi:GNAT family N-acetyltransferase [Micromonospora sp. NPDC050187]|uniref:GNAT family N-acetyltransferase n=1 Tax=Micromonospora sp. NPDC050187 TaxID=3364277 RepID=UPI0037B81711